MLGLRTIIKQDMVCCPAEIVFEDTLRLTGEFFALGKNVPTDGATTSNAWRSTLPI